MAAGAIPTTRTVRSQLVSGRAARRPSPARVGTPEIYFPKTIDNSRLVRVVDPQRNREMAMFTAAVCVLFALVMVYAGQHFSAIEYGYKLEAVKAQRDALVEQNRALRLEEASLRSPERIDALARQMGLEAPRVGQMMRLETPGTDLGAPVLARAASVLVISPQP